jgi:hypothetical protein
MAENQDVVLAQDFQDQGQANQALQDQVQVLQRGQIAEFSLSDQRYMFSILAYDRCFQLNELD